MLHHLLINGLFPEETAQLPLHFDNSAPCCSWGKDAEFRWYVMVLAAICGTFFFRLSKMLTLIGILQAKHFLPSRRQLQIQMESF